MGERQSEDFSSFSDKYPGMKPHLRLDFFEVM